jgi:hypothetical protein
MVEVTVGSMVHRLKRHRILRVMSNWFYDQSMYLKRDNKPNSLPNRSMSVPGVRIMLPLMGFPLLSSEKPLPGGYLYLPLSSVHALRKSPGVNPPKRSYDDKTPERGRDVGRSMGPRRPS